VPRSDVDALIDLIGDPRELDRDVQAFRRSAERFSSDRRRLIEAYPKQWVAVVDGEIRATGDTLPAVLDELDRKGYPRSRALVRFVEKNHRKFIL